MRNRYTVPSTCQQCGAHYLARPDATGKYCGRACSKQAIQAAGAASRVPCPCLVCGKVRMVKPSVLADGKGKYCSWACGRIGVRTHGETVDGSKLSPEYMAWSSMKARCLNPAAPNYRLYGGRGITMCDRWRDSFGAFLADVGRRPSPSLSIDRIDNDRGYEPNNVRWATKSEQSQNRRPFARRRSRP